MQYLNKENFALDFKPAILKLMKNYFSILAAIVSNIFLRVLVLFPIFWGFQNKSILPLVSFFSLSLYLFIVVPLRNSFAEAMEKTSRKENFSWKTCFSYKNYFEKIGFQVKQGLKLIPWALPIILLVSSLAYYYSNTDTLSFSHFFRVVGRNVFGEGAGLMEGFGVLFAAVLLCLAIFSFGVVRNSADRFLRMSPIQNAILPDAEIRRCLIKQRGPQFLIGLFNGVLACLVFLPIFQAWIQEYAKTPNLLLFTPKIVSLDFYKTYLVLIPILYIFVLSIRRILLVAFSSHCRYHREHEKTETR